MPTVPPGESNLARLIRTMHPVLDLAEYVFASVAADELSGSGVRPLCSFAETEGTTVILTADEAQARKLPAEPRWAHIILGVHSSLAAVGFLAAVTGALARSGISVNAVSAFYHDHLFVPWERRDEALRVLRSLSTRSA